MLDILNPYLKPRTFTPCVQFELWTKRRQYSLIDTLETRISGNHYDHATIIS